ncbi:MAG: glycosyltransferase family 4 protein, partial [Patescibacteria group bacterium]|nr:glycosyltransferase family 4 protein [Patescibacteria group bacterium]
FYKYAPYKDMSKSELRGAIKYKNLSDLRAKILALKPEIIQGAEPYGSKNMFLLSILAYSISKKLNIPLIFPCWENRPLNKKYYGIKRILAQLLMKKYVKRASLIFYLNEGAKRNLISAGADKTKIIKFLWGTWGVDIDLFKPKLQFQNSKLKTKDATIVFGGRLDEEKGIRYALYAFNHLQKQIKNSRLILIGGGSLENWARDYVKNNKLVDKVIFTGQIKTKDLPEYFNQAQIFSCLSLALPWWEEQVGMINLQAMSCGLPIVATASGAIPEYVPNGQVGILVPEKNQLKVFEAWKKILQNDNLRLKLSLEARKYVIKNYNAKDNIKKAQKIILALLNDK